MNELITKEVTINGSTFIGVYKGGKVYTPLRKFCEFLGIAFSSQLQRIKRDETLALGLTVFKINTVENNIEKQREMLMLENSFLPLWLAGIKANQCREEIRDNLIKFKLEAKDILAEAFFGKRINQKIENKDWVLDRIQIRLDQCKIIEDQILELTDVLNGKYEEIKDLSRIKQETSEHFLKQFKCESKYDASQEKLPEIIIPNDEEEEENE